MINRQLYLPRFVKIDAVRRESDLVRSFRLAAYAEFKPGQFLQVSCLGAGEVPISISSSPTDKGFIEITVRKSGRVTCAINNLSPGDFLGIRGPFGNCFPLEEAEGKDLIFIAGGIGLAPLRSLIRYVLADRESFGNLHLLYGAKNPGQMISKSELSKWGRIDGFDCLLCVDQPDGDWAGDVGVVTRLFDQLKIKPADTVSFVCGPALMIKYVIKKLLDTGVGSEDIIVTLERYMKCGVGTCGHCYISNKYLCIDGPVFSYRQLKDMHADEVLL